MARGFEVGKKQKVESTDRVKGSILSYAQYRESDFAQLEKRTYVVDLEKNGKKVVFFGTAHTNTPDDPLFSHIQTSFEHARPDYVLVEGMSGINERKSAVRENGKNITLKETAQHGENSFTLKLAVDAGVDFESPEPRLSDEIAYIENHGYSKKDILSYYIFRMVHQYQREHPHVSLEGCREYQKRNLEDFAAASGWNTDEQKLLENEIFNALDIDNTDTYSRLSDPVPWNDRPYTATNEIAAHSGDFRDAYIMERITQLLRDHDSVFAVYGSSHAVRLEPAIRAALDMHYEIPKKSS